MQIDHMAVVVSDLEKSKRFYIGSFGFKEAYEKVIEGKEYETVTGIPDVRIKVAALKINENTNLELVEFIDEESAPKPGFNHFALVVDDIDKYNKTLPNPISRPVKVPSGKVFFYVKDPDGNMIEIRKR